MTKPGPGKFQFNNSIEESEILLQHSLDGTHPSFGESETFGWHCLIVSESLSETEKTVCSSPAYVLEEDAQGFLYVIPYESPVEAMRAYSNLEAEWNAFHKDAV